MKDEPAPDKTGAPVVDVTASGEEVIWVDWEGPE